MDEPAASDPTPSGPAASAPNTGDPTPGDLTDRRFMITGAGTGIGRATALALAARGATLFLAGRSEARTRAAIDAISAQTGSDRLRFLPLDLADLDSVRECARSFLATEEPLHCLVNNAGLAGRRGLTASGFEMAFGTNHVGPFLLTSLLIDRLRASAPARVVNIASDAHMGAKGIDWEAVRCPTRTRTAFSEYGISKLANVLHAQELARRLADAHVSACSLHPGVVASDIWRRVPWPIRPLIKLRMLSPEQGARTPLHCATAPEIAPGGYYENCTPRAPSRTATPELAAELWRRSEEWVAA
ncbi:MAG: SDR family NAD(P)-dependent oxidoreductase [Solirubrobacteraceae bacterium]